MFTLVSSCKVKNVACLKVKYKIVSIATRANGFYVLHVYPFNFFFIIIYNFFHSSLDFLYIKIYNYQFKSLKKYHLYSILHTQGALLQISLTLKCMTDLCQVTSITDKDIKHLSKVNLLLTKLALRNTLPTNLNRK